MERIDGKRGRELGPVRLTAIEDEALFALLQPRVGEWFRRTFGEFSEAQRMAIPAILRQESVLVSSPTGTGKTLAAFLGIMDHLARRTPGRSGGITALYLSPLRALAYDMQKNLMGPLAEMGLGGVRVALRTGDTSASERVKQKKAPPDILLTTPESLAVLLAQPAWVAALVSVDFVVIDEVHAILENKRGMHLAFLLELLEEVRRRAGRKQPLCRVGLSATVRPLERVAAFLAGTGRTMAVAESMFRKAALIEVFSPLRKNPYPPAGYTGARLMGELAVLIATKRTTLVFCNTRGGAERVGLRLREELPDLAGQIEVHHSSLDRSVRLEVEDRLKNGELRAVVCSTSLEMGIDIGSIDLVVMVSAPKGVSRALQRLGRSGHSMKALSHGVLVATNILDLAECAVTSRMVQDRQLDPVRIPEMGWDVLAQGAVAAAVMGPWDVNEFLMLCRRAWPFREMEREDLERVLTYLEGGGNCLKDQYAGQFGKVIRTGEIFALSHPRVARDYLLNIGTLPSEGQARVKKGTRTIGTVDAHFVKGLKVGDIFLLGADCWKVESMGVGEVWVVAARGELPTIPSWNANKMPLTSGLAREVRRLRTDLNQRLADGGDAVEWLVESYEISRQNAEALVKQFEAQRRVSMVPIEGRFLVEIFPDGEWRHLFFHALIGRSGNDALSRVVAWRLQKRGRGNARITIDDYGFLLTVRAEEPWESMDWRMLFSVDRFAEDLREALWEAELVRWQFRGVAQTGLMVQREKVGHERKQRHLQWDAELLFKVLAEHEPDHPLLEESFREATHSFLDAEAAGEFLEMLPGMQWEMVALPRVSPFAFLLYASKIKESLSLEDSGEALERLCEKWFAEWNEETA